MQGRWKVDGWLRRISYILLPASCLLCGGAGAVQRDLCQACAASLRPNRPCCGVCALPMPGSDPTCGRCLKRAPRFDAAWAPYLYSAPIDQLLTRFKFGADLAAGRLLAEMLLEHRPSEPTSPFGAIVPVPLHEDRLRERGCNQALELARPIAAALRCPMRPDLLVRSRATVAQTGLGALARRRNLRGAFSVPPGAVLPPDVLLIDDVMTTGSTLSECARVLKRAGAQRVEVWALARAPRRRD